MSQDSIPAILFILLLALVGGVLNWSLWEMAKNAGPITEADLERRRKETDN